MIVYDWESHRRSVEAHIITLNSLRLNSRKPEPLKGKIQEVELRNVSNSFPFYTTLISVKKTINDVGPKFAVQNKNRQSFF